MHKKTKLLLLGAFCFINLNLFAQTPCENGFANGYPCNQIDFLARIDLSTLSGGASVEGNDIWGWTDPDNGKEYALMGLTNGVVFVDISTPTNPKIIGRLPSHNEKSSVWRDVKVYNNHAFVVADNNSGHGMQVFDLTRLRDAGSSIETYSADARYDGVSSAHNVVINESVGLAYIVGARGASNGCGAGGLHIVDISSPKSPVYAGCFDSDGYTHDAQVVTYAGPDSEYVGKQIAFNSNENTITIADVNNPESTSLISKQGYESAAYAHQGWLTDDHQFFISNDELDELEGRVSKTRTMVWDVRDLDQPTLLDVYFSERSTIDHNLYVKDNLVYQSNYENGLVVLDAEKAVDGKLREVASFDTYPSANNVSFNGTWSNYPYFSSGNIIISDINRGLFIVKANRKEIITEHPVLPECADISTISVGVNSALSIDSYQWQALDGDDISNLSNSAMYSGVNTASLTIDNTDGLLNGQKFRCKVKLTDGSYANSFPTNGLNVTADASFAANSLCTRVTFSNFSTNADTFTWDFGDGSEPSTEQNPTHTYSELGTYTVTLTASNACTESSTQVEVELTNTINPVADFTYRNFAERVLFESLSTNADSYLWDFGDGSEQSTIANPVHTYDELGVYTVTLTASNSCNESTITMELDLLNSLTPNIEKLQKEINIYPNPTASMINISSSSEAIQFRKITVYDNAGRIMHQTLPKGEITINASTWSKGLYLVLIETADKTQIMKKIIRK